jgi:lipoate-protein ligase A
MRIPPWHPDFSETRWDTTLNPRLAALGIEVIDDVPRDAHDNLALDETLLYAVAEGTRPPLFRMWEWSESAVILGSYQSVRDEIDVEHARRCGFTFSRRVSGGGAMVVEAGRTLTWSLIVPESLLEGLSFRQSFAYLDMWCVRVLRGLGIPAAYRPINDIASPGGKISGAAQCRRRRTVLHHVTMAYDMDNAMMWELLRLDQPRNSDKGVPSAVKRVTPLRDFIDIPHAELRQMLISGFRDLHACTDASIGCGELEDAARRRREKFETEEWLYRVE